MSATRGRYIVVTGTIGSGATFLARRMAQAGSWAPLLEADAGTANPFFGAMYADPQRWGLASQVHFLTSSVRRHRAMAHLLSSGSLAPGAKVVEDRTPFEHRAVYLSAQAELGLLTQDEYQLLVELTAVLEADFQVPDVLVHRMSTPEQEAERIRVRNRPGEENMTQEWLAAVRRGFEAMVDSWDHGPVVTLRPDFDATDPTAVGALVSELAQLTDAGRNTPRRL